MIKKFKKVNLVAEVGCNHMGDLSTAKKMIEVIAKFCEVKHVKFQKRDVKKILSKSEYNKPHPVPENSFGKTYGEHRDFLEFNIEKHKKLKKYCKKNKINYSSSAWDLESAKILNKLGLKYIKIPSASNCDFEMLNYLCDNFKGGIHVSLGMTSRKEEKKIFNIFKKKRRVKDLVLYACTSGYPVPVNDCCLLEIDRLYKSYSKYGCEFGFSGHYSGISIDNLAILLGATWIERHFTLDRTWKGTDHSASLEPDGLRRLNRNLNDSIASLQYKKKEILDIEISQRKKLKKL